METKQKLADSKIAAKDIIVDLERVIDRANAAIVYRPGQEIYDASPELHEMTYRLVLTSKAASTVKAGLLRAIGMAPNTRFTPLPPQR